MPARELQLVLLAGAVGPLAPVVAVSKPVKIALILEVGCMKAAQQEHTA